MDLSKPYDPAVAMSVCAKSVSPAKDGRACSYESGEWTPCFYHAGAYRTWVRWAKQNHHEHPTLRLAGFGSEATTAEVRMGNTPDEYVGGEPDEAPGEPQNYQEYLHGLGQPSAKGWPPAPAFEPPPMRTHAEAGPPPVSEHGESIVFGADGKRYSSELPTVRALAREFPWVVPYLEDWAELFAQKHREYGSESSEHDLGVRGQYVDISRKVRKLKRAWWDGVALLTEDDKEVCQDLIGHLLLALRYLARESARPS